MDKNKLKKIIQSLLDLSYDESLKIVEFTALPTQRYDNEKTEWVPDSHSLFLVVNETKYCENHRNASRLIESVLGFECVVDLV
jgi:hypothetical protein